MKTLAVLLLVLTVGCSARGQVHVDTGAPPVHGGAQVALNIQSSSLAALIVAAALLGAAVEGFREDQRASRTPAPLAPDRAVNEQDCSKPIVDPYANLKCK